MDTKTMIMGILDIMYNIGQLNFIYDKILKLTFDNKNYKYTIVLFNKTINKRKTIHLTCEEVYNYIMKYDF